MVIQPGSRALGCAVPRTRRDWRFSIIIPAAPMICSMPWKGRQGPSSPALSPHATGCRSKYELRFLSAACGGENKEPTTMKNGRYDVVILGGGNAGIGVTVAARKAGKSVALIESWVLGGTCPNRGCTPKKVLVAASHSLHEIERAKVQCIAVGNPRLDWAALIDREKDMISDIPNSLAKLMEDRGVEVITGEAAFAVPNSSTVDGATLEAGHIVIATGSK